MKSRASIDINGSIEDVFDFTTGHVAEWSEIVVADEVLQETPEGVGTTFRSTTEERGRRMTFEGVVTRHDRPTAHAVFLKGKPFDIEAEYQFEALDGETRVTQISTVQPKGALKVFFFLFGWLMARSGCKAAGKELANLKRTFESRR